MTTHISHDPRWSDAVLIGRYATKAEYALIRLRLSLPRGHIALYAAWLEREQALRDARAAL